MCRASCRAREFALALLVSVASGIPVAGDTVSQFLTGSVWPYAARPGDSLASVAARYGLEPATLADDNQIRAAALLRSGQVLRIDSRHIPPAALTEGIQINLAQRMLFVAREGRLLGAYPVAVGRRDWPSPVRTFEIGTKEVDPTWEVPESIQHEMASEGRPVLTVVAPGPDNPLGDRWLGLRGISIGIHGTNVPSSIFRWTTHGCIRLHPDDARELFDLVEVSARVQIVYEPVLLAVDTEGQAWIEVHRDAYGRVGDLDRLTRDLLERAGLAGRVDVAAVRRCVQGRRGRPCKV